MFQWTYLNSPKSTSQKRTTESETERARAALRQILVTGIQGAVKQRWMTHTQASFEARVGRTVITAILNGKLNKISTDQLIRIAHRLGLKIELKVSLRSGSFS